MKTLLKVLQYGEHEIRFETDLNVMKRPEMIQELVGAFAYAMTTSLWGGNETTVLAMIRALAIADLAVSVNRKEMIRHLDHSSEMMADAFRQAMAAFKRDGGKVIIFPANVKPSSDKS